jgi:hypothetical protein
MLLVAGIAIHGASIFAGIAAVLLVWGGIGAFGSLRTRRPPCSIERPGTYWYLHLHR